MLIESAIRVVDNTSYCNILCCTNACVTVIHFKVDRIVNFPLYLLQLHCSFRKLLEEHIGTSFDLCDKHREKGDEGQSCSEKYEVRVIEGETESFSCKDVRESLCRSIDHQDAKRSNKLHLIIS